MLNLTSVPDFDEVTVFIKERVDAMRTPARQWADLARLARHFEQLREQERGVDDYVRKPFRPV